MNTSYLIGEIQKDFATEFEGCTLEYEPALLESATAHCFFVSAPAESILERNWIRISNFIALRFQNKLSNEFERWNIYIFYRSKITITKQLHYLIENDTFSSRKIVIEETETNQNVVRDHILNTDIVIRSSTPSSEDVFITNPVIHDFLKDIKFKKRMSTEIETSLEQIISQVKQRSHED